MLRLDGLDLVAVEGQRRPAVRIGNAARAGEWWTQVLANIRSPIETRLSALEAKKPSSKG